VPKIATTRASRRSTASQSSKRKSSPLREGGASLRRGKAPLHEGGASLRRGKAPAGPSAKRWPKSTPAPAIGSWDDVDRLLARLAGLEARAAQVKAEADERICKIRQEAAGHIAPLIQEKKVLDAEIEAFAKAHKKDFGRKRSLALVHGRVGWRRSQSIRFTAKTDEVVAALEARGLDYAVRTTKRASKEDMEDFPDDLLAEVGAKRIRRNIFFVELAESRLEHF